MITNLCHMDRRRVYGWVGLLALTIGVVNQVQAQQVLPPDPKSEVLIAESFEGEFEPVKPSDRARLSGTYPRSAAVRFNSDWADVAVAVGPTPSSAGDGETALRMRVDEVIKGAAQLLILGPIPLEDDAELRLSFRVLGGGQKVHVRLREHHEPGRRPYRLLTQQIAQTRNEWTRVELVFTPPQNPHGGELELRFTQPGEYILDDFELTVVRRDTAAERRALAGQNLLYASSQPAGLTAAWNFRPTVSVAADRLGPTGVAPLRLHVGEDPQAPEESLFVGTVPTTLSGKFTFSFWAKADGSGPRAIQARLYPVHERVSWEPPFSRNIQLTAEWQRVSHTVELPSALEGFHLFSIVAMGHGPDVLVDGLMVEAGERASPFARTAPVELGLTSDRPLGVHYEDESIRVELSAWGELEQVAHAEVRLVDALGQDHTRRVALDSAQAAAETSRGVIASVVSFGLDTLPFGPMRIEARAFDGRDQAVTGVEELILHKVRRPRFEGKFRPDSPFGVHLWPESDQEIEAAARLGFRWARLFHGPDWPTVEPSPGVFDWRTLDRMLDRLEPHGFGFLAILGTTPHWARPPGRGLDTLSEYWAAKAVPHDTQAYADYVERLAQRYAGRIHAYEPWNEPFWARFFLNKVVDGQHVRGTPQQYADLHRAAAGAIRRHDPEALVIWNTGSAFERENVRENDRRIAKEGLLDSAFTDVLTFHDYESMTVPAGFLGDLASTRHPDAVRELATAFDRPGIPRWDSESGMPPSVPTCNFYQHAAPYGRHDRSLETADHLVRVYVSRLSAGVDKWFLYSFSQRRGFTSTFDMLGPDGHLPLFGSVLSNLFWHLEGKGFDAVVALPEGTHAYVFRDDERAVAVLLPSAAGASRLRLDLRDAPAVARDWFGNPLQTHGGSLGRRPVYLTLPSEIDPTIFLKSAIRSDQ
ncbi:MAG: hypothetical protein AAFX76_04505 [Planctomycetota bacterium]